MSQLTNLPTPAPGGGGSSGELARAAFVARQRGRQAHLYLVRVTGAGQTFYGAGVCYSLYELFGRLKRLTYQVTVVAQFSSSEAGAAYDLAQELARTFDPFYYAPTPAFVAGHVPCYNLAAPLLVWLEARAGERSWSRTRVGMGRAAWVKQQQDRKAVLYVVKIYNPDECFYKVGTTFDLPRRLARLRGAYRWRTVAKYSSYNAGKVWDLEQRIHALFAHLSYTPSEQFGGFTECYRSVAEILAVLPPSTFVLKNQDTLI